MSVITQVVNISVTGGYNGGAVLSVKLDNDEVFRAVGDSPYNLVYTPNQGSFETIKGTVNISYTISNSNSPLLITLSGNMELTLSVNPNGSNSSYGYSYTHDDIITGTINVFSIILQTNNSDKNKLDKDVADIATLTGTLKNDTSIINPVILFDGDLSSFVTCNYMTITTFGRSYFVTNIRSVRANLFEITAHVDVLSSFKTQIRQNDAIVKRQENSWNLYLNDGSFRVYQNPNVICKQFPSGFNTQEFVLAVAGDSASVPEESNT